MTVASSPEVRINQLLARHGGVRLCSGPLKVEKKIRVACKEGHQWDVKPASLLYAKSWCKECSLASRRSGLVKATQIARQRNGYCLSESYGNVTQHLEWMCEHDHTFKAPLKTVLMGVWCNVCKAQGLIERQAVRKFSDAVWMAEFYGGKPLSTAQGLRELVVWECRDGHQFTATGQRLLTRQYFCPECDGPIKITLESINAAIAKRGGKCLSKVFVNTSQKLEWECDKGHQWLANWRNVGHNKSWCPTCSRTRGTLAKLVDIADERGGQCLSGQYVTGAHKYKWRCEQGHQFEATMDSAYTSWCWICADKGSEPVGYDRLVKLANTRGGKCISPEYIRVSHKYEWECRKGHRFHATMKSARKTWCTVCSKEAKSPSLDDRCKTLAHLKFGLFLGHVKTKSGHYHWQCEEGHQWKATLPSASLIWCPQCAHHDVSEKPI